MGDGGRCAAGKRWKRPSRQFLVVFVGVLLVSVIGLMVVLWQFTAAPTAIVRDRIQVRVERRPRVVVGAGVGLDDADGRPVRDGDGVRVEAW